MNENTQLPAQEKEIKLKHVKVYDQLYQAIQSGVFPVGSQLPSEPDLALQMNVSRMTLRRALSLLQEDNLIHNIRGKGNFIKNHEFQTHASITPIHQTIVNPMSYCSDLEWDDVEVEFHIEPPTEFITDTLGNESVAVVIADRWYKNKANDTAYSYTLSFIPIEMITKYHINLNEIPELLTYMQETVYEKSTATQALFSHTTTGNFTSIKYPLADHDSFIMVMETIYDDTAQAMICNKHFIPIEHFNMQLSTQKTDYI